MMGDEATWSQQVFGACRCDLGNTPAHGAWSMWGRGRHQSTFRLQPRQLHYPQLDPFVHRLPGLFFIRKDDGLTSTRWAWSLET
jgi:hypothetical protein